MVEYKEKTEQSSDFKIVYKMSLAMKLIKMGFTPITTMPNPNNNKFICWIFENTEEFRKAFNSCKG